MFFDRGDNRKTGARQLGWAAGYLDVEGPPNPRVFQRGQPGRWRSLIEDDVVPGVAFHASPAGLTERLGKDPENSLQGMGWLNSWQQHKTEAHIAKWKSFRDAFAMTRMRC